MKLRWLLVVPVIAALAWCSSQTLPADAGHDSTVDGATVEALCGRVCARFAATTCPQANCLTLCRQTYVMAGDACASLYQAYLTCADTHEAECSVGGQLEVLDCDTVHQAAWTCMGGPSDGGL